MNKNLVVLLAVALVTCISCATAPKVAPVEDTAVKPPPPSPVPLADEFFARCGNRTLSLNEIVGPAIDSMLAQCKPQPPGEPESYSSGLNYEPGIRYTQNRGLALQDYSGVFLRLASQTAAACPDLEDKLPGYC